MVYLTRLSLVGIALLLLPYSSKTQTLSPERSTAWNLAGLTMDIQAPQNQVSVMDFGADSTGVNICNSAYTAAIASLNGSAGTIFFPEGEYFFNAAIAVPDSVFLKGESTNTQLNFDPGGIGSLIQLTGSTISTQVELATNGIKGTYQIELADASALIIGDIIRTGMFDGDLMFSPWAYGKLGQIIEVVGIDGNTLTLADPLNHHYPLSRSPFVKKLNAIRAAGVECMTINRSDNSDTLKSNIYINAGFNCVVRNVESYRCDFGHVDITNSAHIQVERSYFHHGIGYGGGGRAYGIILQNASSFCLAQNNVFKHLRHSMLLQSGANGNVLGYNYSTDPFWDDTMLPENTAGDAVLHGNYPYMNLFEGNTVQHIVIDASHGSNGPFNTFFRNRAELYGFFSDNGTTTDSMNVIGTELTGATFPYGLYNLNGVGHLAHGNNLNGTINPEGTEQISSNTLYLNENNLPAFLVNETLPMVGYPVALNQKTLPAQERFLNGQAISCGGISIGVDIQESDNIISIYPNPTADRIKIELGSDKSEIIINAYNVLGELVQTERREAIGILDYKMPPQKGVYLIQLIHPNGKVTNLNVVKE